jgi:hypothetical protein
MAIEGAECEHTFMGNLFTESTQETDLDAGYLIRVIGVKSKNAGSNARVTGVHRTSKESVDLNEHLNTICAQAGISFRACFVLRRRAHTQSGHPRVVIAMAGGAESHTHASAVTGLRRGGRRWVEGVADGWRVPATGECKEACRYR